MRNLTPLSTWEAAVGLRQPVRARHDAEVMLDLPSRGAEPGPYVMDAKTARALARRLTQMARFAEGK